MCTLQLAATGEIPPSLCTSIWQSERGRGKLKFLQIPEVPRKQTGISQKSQIHGPGLVTAAPCCAGEGDPVWKRGGGRDERKRVEESVSDPPAEGQMVFGENPRRKSRPDRQKFRASWLAA